MLYICVARRMLISFAMKYRVIACKQRSFLFYHEYTAHTALRAFRKEKCDKSIFLNRRKILNVKKYILAHCYKIHRGKNIINFNTVYLFHFHIITIADQTFEDPRDHTHAFC